MKQRLVVGSLSQKIVQYFRVLPVIAEAHYLTTENRESCLLTTYCMLRL